MDWYRRTNLKIDNILYSPRHRHTTARYPRENKQLIKCIGLLLIDVVFTAAGTLWKYIQTEYISYIVYAHNSKVRSGKEFVKELKKDTLKTK